MDGDEGGWLKIEDEGGGREGWGGKAGDKVRVVWRMGEVVIKEGIT